MIFLAAFHYALQSLSTGYIAASKPCGDEASDDALNGAPVKGA